MHATLNGRRVRGDNPLFVDAVEDPDVQRLFHQDPTVFRLRHGSALLAIYGLRDALRTDTATVRNPPSLSSAATPPPRSINRQQSSAFPSPTPKANAARNPKFAIRRPIKQQGKSLPHYHQLPQRRPQRRLGPRPPRHRHHTAAGADVAS